MNRSFLLVVLGLGVAGCSSSKASPKTSDGGPSTRDGGSSPSDGGAIDDGGPTGPTVTLTGTVTDYTSSTPLGGVSVCVYSNPSMTPCTTTDDAGTYSIAAPASSDVILSLTATSHIDDYADYDTSATLASHDNVLFSTSTTNLIAALLDTTIDPTKALFGIFAFGVDGGALAGTTFTVTPAGGLGPYYVKGIAPSTTATFTDSHGAAFLLNAPPGDYQIGAQAPGVTCTPWLGTGQAWPGADDAHGEVVGIAGGLSECSFHCE